MGQVADILNSPDWANKSALEKAAARKDLMGFFLEENPSIKQQFLAASPEEKQTFADDWKKKVDEQFPKAFRVSGKDVRRAGSKGFTEIDAEAPVYDYTTEAVLDKLAPITVKTGEDLDRNTARKQLIDQLTPEQKAAVLPVYVQRYGNKDSADLGDINELFDKDKTLLEKTIGVAAPLAARTIPTLLASPTKNPKIIAASAALGEGIAQGAEQIIGSRQGYDIKEGAINAAFNSINPIKMNPAAGTATRLAGRAAEGAALAGAQNILTQVMGDRPPSLEEFGISLGLGTAFGGGLEGAASLSAALKAKLLGKSASAIKRDLPDLIKSAEGADKDALTAIQKRIEEPSALTPEQNAVQIEEPNAGVLRPEGQSAELGVGLREVAEGNQGRIEAPGTGAKEEVALKPLPSEASVQRLGKKYLVMEGIGEPVEQYQVTLPGEERGRTLTAEQLAAEGYAPPASPEVDISPVAIREKYADVFASAPEGQVPVEIQRPDGTTYPAVVNGYYDLPSGAAASVGRKTDAGWSHGLLKEGEKIISDVPNAEQWARGIRDVAEETPEQAARAFSSQAGFIDANMLRSAGLPLATGAGGFIYGGTQGDTPGERAANAIKYGLLGLGAGSVGSRFVNRDPGAFLKGIKSTTTGQENLPVWFQKLRDTGPVLRLRETLLNNPLSRPKAEVSRVARTGAEVTEPQNYFLKATNYPGVVDARVKFEAEQAAQSVKRNMDEAVDNIAKGTGEDYAAVAKELNEYMRAKTAVDYNREHMAYTEETGRPASGISDERAAQIISEAGAKGRGEVFEDLYRQTKDLNEAALQIREQTGLISADEAAELRKKYPNYVPLNRILPDETDEQAVAGLFGVPKFSIRASGLKTGVGSDLPVDDILNSSLTNLSDAIIRGERNKVGKSLVDFYTAYPNPEVNITTPKPTGKGFGGRLMYDQPKPNQLLVRDGGKAKLVTFDDPLLAKVMNGIGVEKAGPFLRYVGGATQFLAGLYTRFSAPFQIANKVRDIQDVFKNLLSDSGDMRAAGEAAAGSFVRMKDIADAKRGLDTPGARLYREAQLAGAFTGGLAMSNRKRSEQVLNSISEKNPAKRVKNAAMDAINGINEIFNESTYLSVYARAREAGASKAEAANAARNSSIDFNLRSPFIKEASQLYAFIGPAISGSKAAVKSAVKNPRAIGEIAVGLMGIGMAVDAWNKQYDPDWKKKKQNDWYRAHGIPIALPGDGGGYYMLNIPIAQSIRPIKGIVDMGLDYSQGELQNMDEAGSRLVSLTVESMNPLGGQSLRQMFTPTIADPLVDIAANESYTGSRIRPDKTTPSDPASSQVFPRTLDTQTGRGAYEASKTLREWGVEVSPEDILYAARGYGGGPAQIVTQGINAAGQSTQRGGERRPSEIPVIGSFIKYVPYDAKMVQLQADPNLQTLINTQADRRVDKRAEAYRIANEVTQMPDGQQKAQRLAPILQEDPELFTAIRKEIERRESRSDDPNIPLIKSLGVENGERAKYLLERIPAMPAQERAKFIQDLQKADLLSDNVIKQMRLMSEPQSVGRN